MQVRALFPTLMFVLAVASFAYGAWQQVTVRALRASADERTAYMMRTIENSGIARGQKQTLYASLFTALPPMPTTFGIDVSGMFASQNEDACVSDGQRSICAALRRAGESNEVRQAVCGVCAP